MEMLDIHKLIVLYLITIKVTAMSFDKPCAARPINNRSVVCVCNMTYCDEITRETPEPGTFVTYTTSEGGSRFKKGLGYLYTIDNCTSNAIGKWILVLNPEKTYQRIEGFGGAITDSASMIWRSLPAQLQKYLINSYFSKTGIEYNMLRIPIGSSDFSTRVYSLDDSPGDESLKNFSLQIEDYGYKIPMIKESMNVSGREIHLIGSYWSPPRWMKMTTAQNPVCGYLKFEYYQSFADYLYKFFESYETEGVTFWAVTSGNEPSLVYLPTPLTSCLAWSTTGLGNWIANNLGPTFRNSKYDYLKILAMDDQRYTLKVVFEPMVLNNSKVLDNIDGVAVHYYTDSYVAPEVSSYISETYSKFIISTEASTGVKQKARVDLGSWERAEIYAKDVIEDLLNNVIGWIDWNVCLNTEGGPNVDKNYVDSPVIVDADNEEFLKQPMFYILGHFSKFIPRGSHRIDIKKPHCDDSIHQVAFITPSNTILVVICNRGAPRPVVLQLRDKELVIDLEEKSLTTVEFQNE